MKLRSVLACAIAAALPAIAAAQTQARALHPVAMRAGPDRGYPFVASYGAGTPFVVEGCTEGFGWCDVVGPNGYRGWVFAGDLSYPYRRRMVPIASYGPAIGIPIITFAVGPYWSTHYPHRPWYGERHRWETYHPVYRAPPPHRGGPPPAPRPRGAHPYPGAPVAIDPSQPSIVASPPPPPTITNVPK